MPALRDKTILAIAPHVDDVELGAGGLLHRLLPDNDIHYLGLSMPPSVDKKVLLAEFHASIALLGLNKSNILLRDYDRGTSSTSAWTYSSSSTTSTRN